jgi:hypothetical protein
MDSRFAAFPNPKVMRQKGARGRRASEPKKAALPVPPKCKQSRQYCRGDQVLRRYRSKPNPASAPPGRAIPPGSGTGADGGEQFDVQVPEK